MWFGIRDFQGKKSNTKTKPNQQQSTTVKYNGMHDKIPRAANAYMIWASFYILVIKAKFLVC